MKKSTIVMTAAIAAASLSHTVGAEEVAPKPVNMEAPKVEVVETTTPAVATKEEVATKEAEAKKVDQEVVEAKQVVKDAKRATNEADSLVNEKTDAVKKAEDFAKKASPAVIAEAEKEVVKAESAVPAKEEIVKQAEAKATEASQAVSAQETVVAEKEATQTEKEKALTSATEAVQIATDAVNGKGLENAKEAQKEAVEAEKTSKQAQTDAETALAEAEKANQATNAQIEDTKADIATKTQAVLDAKAEQEKAEKAVADITANYNQAVSVLDSIKNTKHNTIKLAPEFIEAVKERMQLQEDFRRSKNKSNFDFSRFPKTFNKVKETQMGTPALNQFIPLESDLADETKYDVNHIPEDFKRDLTFFAADLINQMREQVGLLDVKVTADSFTFAEKIAKEYTKAKVTNVLLDSYRKQKGGFGHYAIGINKVAKEYGLDDGNSESERINLENKGVQSYEVAVSFTATDEIDSDVFRLTKSEMRKFMYTTLVRLISTENDFGHTSATIGFDKEVETQYFGGVAQSHTKTLYRDHVIAGIPESYMTNSTFDRNEIENPYTKARKANKIKEAEALVNSKKVEKTQAEQALQTASQNVNSAETALNSAKKSLEISRSRIERYSSLETSSSISYNNTQSSSCFLVKCKCLGCYLVCYKGR